MTPVDWAALDTALQPVAGWLGTFALHSSVALLLAWGIASLLGRRGIHVQEALLRQSLWLPLLSTTLQVCVFGSPWAAWLPDAVADVDVEVLASHDFAVGATDPGFPLGSSATPFVAAGPVPETGPTIVPWSLLLVGGAALAAVAGLGWLAILAVRLRRLLASRRPETNARVLTSAARMAHALGLKQSPQISRSNQLATPIAFGWLRPEICLPERAQALDDSALAAMLGHELAHLRRADPAWMWFAASVQAIAPWQLLLSPVRRRWARIVELRCDAVAAAETSPTSVARCLVEVAGWLRPEASPVVALGMAARPSALRERVEAALGGVAVPSPRRAATAVFAAMSLSALTLAAPGLQHGATTRLVLDAMPLQADDPVFGAAPSPLLEAVQMLGLEHELLADEAMALLADLEADPVPESRALAAALRQRLDDLTRLRARLEARAQRSISPIR